MIKCNLKIVFKGNLKAREKQLVMYKGTPVRLSAEIIGQKGVEQHIESAERKKLRTKNTLPSKIEGEREFPR